MDGLVEKQRKMWTAQSFTFQSLSRTQALCYNTYEMYQRPMHLEEGELPKWQAESDWVFMRDAKRRIPEDAAFVGFDELPGQIIFGLPYSCLDREVTQLGVKAAQLLVRRFEEPNRPAERMVVVPRLSLRGSEEYPSRPRTNLAK